jgi:hypothetical protein
MGGRILSQPKTTWAEEEISAVGYQETANEDVENSECCSETQIAIVSERVIITCSYDL